MNMPLIKIENVIKTYTIGDTTFNALDGVSLNIYEKDFVSIVGPSGSGKSTFMNMLGCLDVPTSGKYYINNYDVSKMSEDELAKLRNKTIGFIFQGFNLLNKLTAYENVELPLIYQGISMGKRREMVINALKRVGLDNRMNHKPNELSGGQQQRVAIARALSAKPPIILADEPTGNLDSKSGSEVLKMLKELNEEGKTIILITHDNDIAKQAKRIVRIADGKITMDSKSEDLKSEVVTL